MPAAVRKGAADVRLHLALCAFLPVVLAGFGCAPEAPAPVDSTAGVLRVNGSTTVNPVVSRAAEVLRAERDLEITVDTQGGSSGGISALGDGRVEVGMSSRPLDARDREKYPDTEFKPVRIAVDALALVVSKDVWEGGVRALTREEVRRIYEDDVESWSEVGGPDRPIVFFNKEPGRGTWEVFADWLYGDADEAPFVSHPEVGSNEEGRTKVASTRGAISQLSAAWADGESVFALGLRLPDGRVVRPEAEDLRTGRYPLARPLLVITDGEPEGSARVLIDFLLGPRGQELAAGAGYLPLAELEAP